MDAMIKQVKEVLDKFNKELAENKDKLVRLPNSVQVLEARIKGLSTEIQGLEGKRNTIKDEVAIEKKVQLEAIDIKAKAAETLNSRLTEQLIVAKAEATKAQDLQSELGRKIAQYETERVSYLAKKTELDDKLREINKIAGKFNA